MLYVPFAVGTLVAATFSWRMLLLLLSVTSLFIARESLLVWWRGGSHRQTRQQARRVTLIYLAFAAAIGGPLVWLDKLYWLVPLAAASAGLLLFNAQQARRRADRTIFGETIAILGLTLTAPAAYYVATGTVDRTALWLWAMCALYFTSSIFYVKLRVYAMNRRKPEAQRHSWRLCALYHLFLLGGLTVLATAGGLNPLAMAAFAPALARSFWQLVKPAAELNLRRIGVMEIVYSLVFLVFITMTFRVV